MKALIILLLLATVAWGEDIDWTKFKDGDFICVDSVQGYIPCYVDSAKAIEIAKTTTQLCCNGTIEQCQYLPWYPLCDLPKTEKGHCPHCGTKGDPMDVVRFSTGNYSYKVFFCPNGHIFNEKD